MLDKIKQYLESNGLDLNEKNGKFCPPKNLKLKNLYSQCLAVGIFLLICLCSCGNSTPTPALAPIDTAQNTVNPTTISTNQPVASETEKTEPKNVLAPASEENVLVVNANELTNGNEIVVSAEAENDENNTAAEEEPSTEVKTLTPQEVVVDIDFSEVAYVDITNRGFGQSYRRPVTAKGMEEFKVRFDFPTDSKSDTITLKHKKKYRVIVYKSDRETHSIRKATSFIFDKKFDPTQLIVTIRVQKNKKK